MSRLPLLGRKAFTGPQLFTGPQRPSQAATAKPIDANADRLSNVQKLYAIGGVLDVAAIVVGSMSKASAIRAQGKFEEEGFVENARRLRLAAEDALRRGDKNAEKFLRGIRRLMGTQKAALGAQGIEIGRGTAARIVEDTFDAGAQDSQTIRSNAVREAFGFEKQAIEQEFKAQFTRIGRKSASRQVLLSGVTQVAGSVASVAGNIQKVK